VTFSSLRFIASIPISTLENIRDIKEGKNVLLLDEIWVTADARQSQKYENMLISSMLLQSRKRKCDVFYTTQYINQVDVRIRAITNMIISPSIMFVDKDNIPVIIELKILRRDLYGDMYEKKKVHINTYGAEQLYNTDEIIETLGENLADKYMEKYKGWKGYKGELVSLLQFDEGLSNQQAYNIANYIFAKKSLPTVIKEGGING